MLMALPHRTCPAKNEPCLLPTSIETANHRSTTFFLQDMPAKYIYEPWTAPLSVQQAAGCIIGKDYPRCAAALAVVGVCFSAGGCGSLHSMTDLHTSIASYARTTLGELLCQQLCTLALIAEVAPCSAEAAPALRNAPGLPAGHGTWGCHHCLQTSWAPCFSRRHHLQPPAAAMPCRCYPHEPP